MNKTIIGILGGMGPEASAKFYMDLTKRTKAQRDQDHYHVIIDSNAKIPDRSLNIISGAQSPVEEIKKSIDLFHFVKADVAVMTCITSHHYIEEIEQYAKIPILNAISLTSSYLKKKFQDQKIKVGVLATNGSVKTRVFDQYMDFELLYPSENSQKMVMAAIYGDEELGIVGIKNHKTGSNSVEKTSIKAVAKELIEEGANVIIAGCTEIPLVLNSADLDVNVINPMDVVIDHILEHFD